MNRFKIGVMADWLGGTFRHNIETSAAMGAQGVQLYATGEFSDFTPDTVKGDRLLETKDILASCGIEVSALCGDLGGHGFQIPADNVWKIEKSKRIIDLALELGANVVTTHIGVVPDTVDDTYRIMQQACNELAEYAQSVGAYFAVETGPEKAAMLKGFLDSLSARGVRVNFDPANLVMVTQDDPVAAVPLLGDYIVHTHAKDGVNLKPCDRHAIYNSFAEGGVDGFSAGDYIKEVPLGQGSVDFPAYIAALAKIDYRGYLTVEREIREDPRADIEMAVNFLKELTAPYQI